MVYSSYVILFPVLTPDNFSSLKSVLVWLSRGEGINKFSGNTIRGMKKNWLGGPKKDCEEAYRFFYLEFYSSSFFQCVFIFEDILFSRTCSFLRLYYF